MLTQQIRKRYYKNLGTSVINSSLSPFFLIKNQLSNQINSQIVMDGHTYIVSFATKFKREIVTDGQIDRQIYQNCKVASLTKKKVV